MMPERRIKARAVVEYVAKRHGVSLGEITGRRVLRSIARPRQIAMYVIREACPHLSLPQIGRALGGRDHTTVIHAVRKVESLMAADPAFAAEVKTTLEYFRGLPADPVDLMLTAQIDAASKHLEALILEARGRIAMAGLATL